jgi:hypothetical protein
MHSASTAVRHADVLAQTNVARLVHPHSQHQQTPVRSGLAQQAALTAAVQPRTTAASPASAPTSPHRRDLRHRDRPAQTPYTTQPPARSTPVRGLILINWPDVRSRDTSAVPTWWNRPNGDPRAPLIPPAPYTVPPFPLIDLAVWIGTDPRRPPIIDDLVAIPTAAYTGRPLDSGIRTPWRPRIRHTFTVLALPWTERPVIYGGPGPGTGDGDLWITPFSRRVIPSRYAYMILHALTCVRLPDRTPLPWKSATLRLAMPEWAWTLALDLTGQNAAALIEPEGDDPVEIEIALNGATWIFLAEDWNSRRAHGTASTVSVSGRSRSAYLSSRYQRQRDYTETQARTLAQLGEQELPYGGGWELLTEVPDWLVPAGAWSYQALSPIQAIARLGAAAGGLLYPDPADRKLTWRPIHRLAPWDISAGQEDLLIPAAAILSANRRYRYPDQADGIHVYGGAVGGLQALVYRAGTAGATLAPEISDPLMTHTDALRALGARHLAAHARPIGYSSITLAVDPRADFPIPVLGDLIRIQLDGGQTAPCTAIEIQVQGGGSANPVTIRQTLALGETQSDYQRLLSLLPQTPTTLAQVTATHSDGTVTCATANGGTLRVLGIAVIGAWVWVQGQRIIGTAPEMPAYNFAV